MQSSPPVSLNAGTQPEAPIFRLHEDLLVSVAEYLPIQDLVHLTHVCRLWRAIFLRCNWIWGRLNLRQYGDSATQMAIALFPRSGDASLDLSLRLTNRVPDGTVRNLLTCLAPHTLRLRHLSMNTASVSHYGMLFDFLRNPMPRLYSLDVSPGAVYVWDYRPVQPPRDILSVAPSLAHLNWGIHILPSTLNCLANVTRLHIRPSSKTLARIFTLFPRIIHLRIDSFYVGEMQSLPIAHPLQRVKLCQDPPDQMASKIAWSDLDRLGLTRVRSLLLRNYGLSVLFASCEAGWQAHTLVIEYDDTVDAALSRGAQDCRMLGLVGGDRLGELTWKVPRLLYQRACLRGLVSLTMSLFRPSSNPRPLGLLPCIVLHVLETFTLLCGRPPPSGDPVCSLLDDALLREAGTLRAPRLRTLRLQARTPHTLNDDDKIKASSLARLISEHIQLQDPAHLPELRVDHPSVQFSDDPEGFDILEPLVGTIVYQM